MSSIPSERLLQHIRRIAGDVQQSLCDAELLHRYRDSRDPAAFDALLRRHGAMVFAVCQSVLRQRQDSEDAFQAVFLILARQAGSIGRPEALGGWLQRVAFRVALRARAGILRRRDCEAKAARALASEPSCDDLSWGELRTVLHEELAALPERFRAPLVLCYLEGLTQEEAARQLGWTAASVKGRLQRGRDKLRRRLERRGIALTAALGAALTGQTFAETAARSVRHFTTASATATATALAHGFMRSWMAMKLGLLSALLLSASVVAGGTLFLAPKPEEEEPPVAAADKFADNKLSPPAAVDAHGDPLPEAALTRLGTVRLNHGHGMLNLLFSPDGKKLLSRGGGAVCLWDAATGAELLRGASEPNVWDRPEMAVRPGGKTLLSLHQQPDGDVVREWDFATLKETGKRVLSPPRQNLSVYLRNALSADGRLAAVHTASELCVFDLTTGRQLCKLAKGGKDIVAVVFGGDWLITADRDQTIDLQEPKTGKFFRRINHDAPAGYLAASSDGRWLAVLEHHYEDGPRTGHWPTKDRVHVWDLQTGVKKHEWTLGANHWFRSAYFLGDGKRLLTSSIRRHGSELTVWDVESGKRLREIRDVYGNAIAVSADGRRVAVGYDMGKFDLWDLETGQRVSSEDGRHVWAATVYFLPADDRILTLGYHSFSTWDARTGKRLESVETPHSSDWNTPRRGFSPDGRYAVSFTGDGKEFQAILWDIAARRQHSSLPLPSDGDYVYVDAVFSPDSSLLAIWQPLKTSDAQLGRVDSPAVIHIWDARLGKEIRSFKERKCGWPGQLSFSADGKTLLVAGKHVVGFEAASGKVLFSWRMKPLPDNSGTGTAAVNGKPLDPNDRCAWRALDVSPDGSLIACILDGGFGNQPLPDRIALFDARSGRRLRRWSDSGKPSPTHHEQIAFSPDGQLLASSDGFGLHLWEVATGKEIRAFHGHRSDIISLAFRGDGRRLASTSWDSTVLIWDLTAPPANQSLEKCWADLASSDARRAHAAVWTLARRPNRSLPLVRDRLRPVKPVSRTRLERLIRDLDGEQFAAREKATEELHKLGEQAAPALRRVLEDKPTLEQRRRIEPILAEIESRQPIGETLRSLRAVRVLEQAGTEEARRLLRELASGAERAALTRESQAALTRLNRRAP